MKNNITPLLTIIIGILITILTIKGITQEYIKFEDPINEIIFAVAGILVVIIGVMGIEIKKK